MDFDNDSGVASMDAGEATEAPDTQPENSDIANPTDAPDQSQETVEEGREAASPAATETEEKPARTDWRAEYFNAKKTFEPKIAELESKVKEYEESAFQGVKIDKPSNEWEPIEQIKQLPEKYQGKLLDSVFENFLPQFAQGVLQDPQSHQQEYGQLAQVAASIASQTYGRPVDEIDAIMQLTHGISAQELQQLLTQGFQPQQGYQSPYVANGAPKNSQLIQLAEQAGLDLEDPQHATFLSTVNQILTVSQNELRRELQQVKSVLSEYQSKSDQSLKTQQQAQVEQMKASVDKQAESVRTGLLGSVTKGRVVETDMSTPVKITERAEYRLMRDEKAQQALARARDFAADGFEAGIRQEMKLYAARASVIYQEIAKDELGANVSKTSALRDADQKKAARTNLLSGNGGAPLNTKPSGIDELVAARKPSRPQDWGEIAAEEVRRRAQ